MQEAQRAVAGVPVGAPGRPSNDLTAGAIAGIGVAAAVALVAVVALVLWAVRRRGRRPGGGDSPASKQPRISGSDESAVRCRAPCMPLSPSTTCHDHIRHLYAKRRHRLASAWTDPATPPRHFRVLHTLLSHGFGFGPKCPFGCVPKTGNACSLKPYAALPTIGQAEVVLAISVVLSINATSKHMLRSSTCLSCVQTGVDGLIAGRPSGSQRLSGKYPRACGVPGGTSGTIAHAAPAHHELHMTHGARSAAALPGSPCSDISSSAMTIHGTVGDPAPSRGSLLSGTTSAALSGGGTTLKTDPDGSRGGGFGSTAATAQWGGERAPSAAVASAASDSPGRGPGATVLSALSFADTTEMRTFLDATHSEAPPLQELEVMLLALRAVLRDVCCVP